MQVYENKTLHMLKATIDDEPVCARVHITNSNYEQKKKRHCLFLTITCKYAISYKKIRGTPETSWRNNGLR
jgi:hypothetical protein